MAQGLCLAGSAASSAQPIHCARDLKGDLEGPRLEAREPGNLHVAHSVTLKKSMVSGLLFITMRPVKAHSATLDLGPWTLNLGRTPCGGGRGGGRGPRRSAGRYDEGGLTTSGTRKTVSKAGSSIQGNSRFFYGTRQGGGRNLNRVCLSKNV